MLRAQLGRLQLDEAQIRRNVMGRLDKKIFIILSTVKDEILEYLKSYIGELRPPERKVKHFGGNPEAPRPAHPGHWADVSGDLKEGYRAEVERGIDGRWQLKVWNEATNERGELIAPFVEARAGYFVVSGIMDAEGPVQHAIKEAFMRFDGDATIRQDGEAVLVNYTT